MEREREEVGREREVRGVREEEEVEVVEGDAREWRRREGKH